ncbi:MAG: hypothetical protein KGN84_02830 [Acidobacteriota bacterium]|nr:hypothetical protein [Acidobacteriota bacterium]
MPEQSYEKHAQIVPPFHFFLLPLSFLAFIGSLVNLYESYRFHFGLYSASLITVLSFLLIVAATFGRIFALKAQDRLIRLEENFRHYLITGKPLDSRITVDQAIGLRFASDNEFPALCKRAAEEGLSRKDIKKAVTNWRADLYRV